MKAVGYYESLPADDPHCLLDIELPDPVASGRDVRVRVAAVSVNPVDTKVRRRRVPSRGVAEVLGWDAVGEIDAVGSDVRGFAVGDRVWYAGAFARPGSNSELQLVDERLVALAPRSLPDAAAAALPLTAITAWELLFERFALAPGAAMHPATLLITAGAGGVGSMLIQLARSLTSLTVVATASRPESRAWATQLGAHAVLDYTRPLVDQIGELGVPPVRYVASLSHTAQHFTDLITVLAPQGRLGVIDDFAPEAIDVTSLKAKSLSLHWESMFTRSTYQTDDMAVQGQILAEVAKLVGTGKVRSTVSEVWGVIDAANLRRAHKFIETGRAVGKVVLEGFPKASAQSEQ